MADFFEFEESEIVFSDDSSSNQLRNNNNDRQSNSRSIRVRTNTISSWRKDEQSSVPVNIPGSPNSFSSSSSPSSSPRYGETVDFGGYFFEDDNEMVPPHVIVDRRRSSGFDSYEKNVRVKNMIHVRNSILKLTGFLES